MCVRLDEFRSTVSGSVGILLNYNSNDDLSHPMFAFFRTMAHVVVYFNVRYCLAHHAFVKFARLNLVKQEINFLHVAVPSCMADSY